MTRDEVVAEARKWIDVPYRRRGRSRTGVDCIGLVIVTSLPFQIPYEDVADYTDWPHPDRLILREFSRFLVTLPASAPFPGTIGVFTGSILPVHVGIFSMRHGRTHFIHARRDEHRVLEQEYRPEDKLDKQGRLLMRYAFPGLED